ncbi:MAG: hypothetical protein ACKVIS_01510 [Pseudomonadales bacterium]|uniref:hypothetical protein n=1 Tax=uncultured Pseudomonas sp. TaxID=114707 RepID=UPI0030D7247F|tara:strand:+ start:40610 stop:40948 length:339 start_codon:yes stop_codon:yes gene_type:complete
MRDDLQALQQRFGPRYPQWLLALLMVGSMAMVLASTSINVALPAIMADFAIGRPLAQWLSTGFLAAMTAGLLLAAWPPGRRRALVRGVRRSLVCCCLSSVHWWRWWLMPLGS